MTQKNEEIQVCENQFLCTFCLLNILLSKDIFDKIFISIKINTIFGNDPAGPLFNVHNPDRLDAIDADYTGACITNAGQLGFDLPITHATF